MCFIGEYDFPYKIIIILIVLQYLINKNKMLLLILWLQFLGQLKFIGMQMLIFP